MNGLDIVVLFKLAEELVSGHKLSQSLQVLLISFIWTLTQDAADSHFESYFRGSVPFFIYKFIKHPFAVQA